jgi:hypothetical protein
MAQKSKLYDRASPESGERNRSPKERIRLNNTKLIERIVGTADSPRYSRNHLDSAKTTHKSIVNIETTTTGMQVNRGTVAD